MNINENSAKRHCTSCQMCAAVCPQNAISISIDKDGFYRPIVDCNLCIECNTCTKVCYKFEDHIEAFGVEKLENTKLYGASAKDEEVVRNTTSGGIADLIACHLVKEGYKCVGVVYDSERDAAIDIIATSEKELIGFRGSKYIQSYTLDAFKEVVEHCKADKYAIFGTPCHIYALDRYFRFRKVRDHHILIDLYCHGCPSMNIWKKYVKDVKTKIKEERIDNVNFRSKAKGWGNFFVEAIVNGRPVYYSNNKHNEFFDLFFSDLVLNDACNDCVLRGTLAYTDIRLGDFWGKQYVMNNKGVSAVSLVSNKAKKVFEEIADRMTYKEERYDNFLPWQSWGKVHHPKPQLREQLLSQLRDENVSLRESIETIYHQQSLIGRLSRYGKRIVHALPIQFEKCLRWVFYKIH